MMTWASESNGEEKENFEDLIGNNSMSTSVLPGLETQTLLSSIYPLKSIKEIGTDKFMIAYCVNLERLSIQAHTTAKAITKEKSLMVNVVACHRENDNRSVRDDCNDEGKRISGAFFGDMSDAEDEYIVKAFLENSDKIEALVRTLLALELWRENVLFYRGDHSKHQHSDVSDGDADEGEKSLEEVGEHDTPTINIEDDRGLAMRLATNGNVLRTAFILHAETTIVALLNLIFYKGVPPELLSSKDERSSGRSCNNRGDDVLLSLIDYCARQLIFLGTPEEYNPAIARQKHPLVASQLSIYLQKRTRIEEIRDTMYETMYRTAIAAVSLSRFLCENSNEYGPSLLSRLLEVHDFPLLVEPLIEEPPWTRRRCLPISHHAKDGDSGGPGKETDSTKMIWEKLDENNNWKEVPSKDLLRLTQLEGQPWLTIFHLVTSKSCRESYALDEYRKSQLMRLRKYIHETLMDQLPVLADVARYLDELCILGVPPSSGNASLRSGMLLHRVDLVRDSFIEKENTIYRKDIDYWKVMAQVQWDEVFSNVTDSSDLSLRRIASEVYGGVDDLPDDSSSSIESIVHIDTKKDMAQSTLDKNDCVVDKVIVQMVEESAQVVFELVPIIEDIAAAAPSTIVTPLGTFLRIKLSICQRDVDCEAVFPHAKIVATIHLQNDSRSCRPREMVLCIESLSLPTVKHDSLQDDYDEVGIELPVHVFTPKEWRQLGNIETDNVVIQLGFKRLARGLVKAGSSLLRGYSLSQAFISIRSSYT